MEVYVEFSLFSYDAAWYNRTKFDNVPTVKSDDRRTESG